MPAIKKVTIKATKENTVESITTVATLRLNGISIDIYSNASSQFIRNLVEAFTYVK